MFRHIGENVIIREWVRFVRPENIWIESHVRIDDFVLIAGGRDALTRIGNYVHVATFSSILGSPGSVLEDFVTIAPGCRLFSVSDDYLAGALAGSQVPWKYRSFISGQITLCRFAAIGANTVILPGVTIGEGAVVGACSLVTKDVEAWTVNIGIPTHPIRFRNRDEVRRRAEELCRGE